MLDGGSGGSSVMQWATALAALMVTALGTILYHPSLVTSRPPPPSKSPSNTTLGDEQVSARLWQDPFKEAAAARDFDQAALNAAGGQPDGLRYLKHLMKSDVSSNKKRILLLPVMSDADPYGEDAEQRLRVRIAVDDALSTCGYRPHNPLNIGYATVPWHAGELSPSSDFVKTLACITQPEKSQYSKSLLIPFEKWDVGNPVEAVPPWPEPPYDEVIVFWLAEEMFSDVPLSRLAAFTDEIVGLSPKDAHDLTADQCSNPSRSSCECRNPSVTVRIIGPRASTTMEALLMEANQLNNDNSSSLKEHLHGAKIYAATPTADDRVLLCATNSPFRSIAAACGSVVELHRTTITDDIVTKALAQELNRRGVLPTDQIVLISEWDSYYGRALPLSFAANFCGLKIEDILTDPSRIPPTIHRFRYLRGIDGRVFGDDGKAEDEDNSRDTSDNNAKAQRADGDAADEHPEGLDQADYLRRLAKELAELNADLGKSHDRIRAVGVLGTDLYDKLLVLRALRDQMPDAIFFTTEIDARYALPREWSATHNLICASSFGLRLQRFFQQGMMPFRDSEETAEFFGTLCAVFGDDPGPIGSFLRNPESLGTPRLSEIGFNGSVDLSVGDSDLIYPNGDNREFPDSSTKNLQVPKTIQPPRYNLGSSSLLSWSCIVALIAVVVFHFLPGPRSIRILIYSLFIAIFAGYIFALIDPIEGEPSDLFQRVNVWPTEIMRLMAAFLSVLLIIETVMQNRRVDADIERNFRLQNAAKSIQEFDNTLRRAQSWWGRSRRVFQMAYWLSFGQLRGFHKRRDTLAVWDTSTISRLSVSRLWMRYLTAADWRPRVSCSFISALMALLIVILVQQFFIIEPLPPTRGNFAYLTDRLCIGMACLGLCTLTAYTVIGAMLNAGLMDKITSPLAYPYFPSGAFDSAPFRASQIEFHDLTEALTMQLLVQRTSVAGRTIYHPLIILFIMLVARAPFFSDWKISIIGVSVTVGCLILTLGAAWYLKQKAEEARRRLWSRVRQRSARKVMNDELNQSQILDRIAEYISSERHGMFSNVLPVIFVFLGTIAVWIVIDYFSQAI